MAWRNIIDVDVLNEFTPIEKQTLNGIQGATTQLPLIVANIIGQVRGSIAAGGHAVDAVNPLTVPDQLRGDVIALARWKWLASFPVLKSMQTDARKNAGADAEKKFDEVANGKLNIESPTGTTMAPAAGGSRRRVPGRMGYCQ